jgi:hypothetical protein
MYSWLVTPSAVLGAWLQEDNSAAVTLREGHARADERHALRIGGTNTTCDCMCAAGLMYTTRTSRGKGNGDQTSF